MNYEIHRRTVERLVQRAYDQPLINNVERGAYVEHMSELLLREHHLDWSLTDPWFPWDLEHRRTLARIEIKQSAALQRWRPSPRLKPRPRFSIKRHEGYFAEDGATWIDTPLQRYADLYVFAWHPVEESDIADHRRPDQWKFFVVAEECLSEQDSIGLGPLTQLVECRDLAESCNYEALASMVAKVLKSLDNLKTEVDRPRLNARTASGPNQLAEDLPVCPSR